jgi:hypothetical protein
MGLAAESGEASDGGGRRVDWRFLKTALEDVPRPRRSWSGRGAYP